MLVVCVYVGVGVGVGVCVCARVCARVCVRERIYIAMGECVRLFAWVRLIRTCVRAYVHACSYFSAMDHNFITLLSLNKHSKNHSQKARKLEVYLNGHHGGRQSRVVCSHRQVGTRFPQEADTVDVSVPAR